MLKKSSYYVKAFCHFTKIELTNYYKNNRVALKQITKQEDGTPIFRFGDVVILATLFGLVMIPLTLMRNLYQQAYLVYGSKIFRPMLFIVYKPFIETLFFSMNTILHYQANHFFILQ